MNELNDEIKDLVFSNFINGEIDEAINEHKKRLEQDPEWNIPKYYHIHTLVTAFIVGIMNADVWHKNYRIPPNVENVVNWISFNLQRHFKNDEIVKISLIEYKKLVSSWAYENPNFRKWNESDDETPIAIVSRYSSIPDKRDFIDLDVIIHNASIFLRDEKRKNEAFDREFDEKQYNTNENGLGI